MGIFGNKNKTKKLNPRDVFTMGEVMKMIQDERFCHYEFQPVDSDNMQAGFRAVSKEIVRESIEKIKRKREMTQGFREYVVRDGEYQGIGIHTNFVNDYKTGKNDERYYR